MEKNNDKNQRIEDNKLSKKERYLLKKQRKEEISASFAKKKKIKKMVKIGLPIVLVAAGILIAVLSYSPEIDNGLAMIDVSPIEYDAGTVSMGDGLVKHTYEIKNTGKENLKIDKIWTSCMCTTAHLRVGDETSPEFGMHNNPVFWSQEILPGETGYLDVVFDPAFHGPSGTGRMVRAVYLSTNDPKNKKAEVKLLINVIN